MNMTAFANDMGEKMMKAHALYKPDDWRAQRATGIGGSDCAAALGLSPWKSPLQLYLEKTGDAPQVEESEAMRFGTLLEPIVRGEYVRRTGRNVVYGQGLIRDVARPWMLANLDGFTADDGPRVVEAKTARDDREWGEPGTDAVPQQYLLQVTHYMIVTGAQLADIAVLFGGSDFRIYTVERNPELVELVIAGERLFWDAVEAREPPSPQTLAEINLRWKDARPRAVELPPNVAKACERLREIKDEIETLDAEGERCEALIKMEMADADTATIDGVPAVTWKQAKPSRVFDAKAFREARPEIAHEYEVEKPGSRRFLLKL